MDEQAQPAPAAEADLPEVKTFTLRKPLNVGGNIKTELTLREPTAGEFERTAKIGGVSGQIDLISRQTTVPPDLVRGLPVRDFLALSGYLDSFFADDPTTGANASSSSPSSSDGPQGSSGT